MTRKNFFLIEGQKFKVWIYDPALKDDHKKVQKELQFCTTWELLNMDVDDICKLTTEVYKFIFPDWNEPDFIGIKEDAFNALIQV